jgi:hypothetical protein
MNDKDKTKEQLIAELVELRQRLGDRDERLAAAGKSEDHQRRINDALPVLIATAGLDGYYKEVPKDRNPMDTVGWDAIRAHRDLDAAVGSRGL